MKISNTYKYLLATTALCFSVESYASNQVDNAEYTACRATSAASLKALATEIVNNGDVGAFLANVGADDAVIEAKLGQQALAAPGVQVTIDGAIDTLNNLIDPAVNPVNLTTAVKNVKDKIGASPAGASLFADLQTVNDRIDNAGILVTNTAITNAKASLGLAPAVNGNGLKQDAIALAGQIDSGVVVVQTAITNAKASLGLAPAVNGNGLQEDAAALAGQIDSGVAVVQTAINNVKTKLNLTPAVPANGLQEDLTALINAASLKIGTLATQPKGALNYPAAPASNDLQGIVDWVLLLDTL